MLPCSVDPSCVTTTSRTLGTRMKLQGSGGKEKILNGLTKVRKATVIDMDWKEPYQKHVQNNQVVSQRLHKVSIFHTVYPGGNEMTYNFHCDGKDSCTNTRVDEQLCSEEKFVCNKKSKDDVEEYVSQAFFSLK